VDENTVWLVIEDIQDIFRIYPHKTFEQAAKTWVRLVARVGEDWKTESPQNYEKIRNLPGAAKNAVGEGNLFVAMGYCHEIMRHAGDMTITIRQASFGGRAEL
jgi:hypothetical protein